MKKELCSKKSGFSLIELAIVLIIIGLLIAGVTGGAALIKSAELRAVVTEARSNSISASAFFSLYDSLPGDSNSYTAYLGGAVGNQDGKIEFCRTGTCATTVTSGATAYTSEGGALAWGHLTNAGIVSIPGFTQPTSGDHGSQALGSAPSFLPSKIKQSGWMFDYDSTNTPNANISILTGTGVLGANLEAATDYTILLANDAYSIDLKNDDGKPTTGSIRGAGNATSCIASGAYVVATATKTCTVYFVLDVGN